MLQVVNGKLMNSRDVGNAVAKLLMEGMAVDLISDIEGMPSPTQIAWMRKNDPQFAEGLTIAFEGAGIEAAFVLMKGSRDGAIGKNQVEAAKWVAERMAPDLFQERRTVTTQEIPLTDEELHAQLEAAARTDKRVQAFLEAQVKDQVQSGVITIDIETDKRKRPQRLKRVMKQIRRSK